MGYYHEQKELIGQMLALSVKIKKCVKSPESPAIILQLKKRIEECIDWFVALVVSQEWNEIGCLCKILNQAIDLCDHIKREYKIRESKLQWEILLIDCYDLLYRIHDTCSDILNNELGLLP